MQEEIKPKRRIPLIPVILAVLVLIGAGVYAYVHVPDEVLPKVSMEAGAAIPGVEKWLKDLNTKKETVLLTDLSGLDNKQIGRYPVTVKVGRFEYESVLEIEDTIPPVGNTVDREVLLGTELTAEDFAEAYDLTGVTVRYGEEPDLTFVGTQDVHLELVDGGGNITELTAQLTVFADTEPPVITGVEDQELTEGETISYKQGVSVTDDYDEKPGLEIDNSQVDLNTPGTYTVIYTATDASGNSSQAEAVITVKSKEIGIENYDEMARRARNILDEILYDGQSDLSKLYEIFWYVKRNMVYVNESDKTSYINEAIRGMKEGYGDCFTYYSVLRALMEQAGFETVSVQRLGGETQHFWSLVRYKGQWYHIDSCPRSVDHLKYWYTFLRTDEELVWFRNRVEDYYYKFDTSLYPETATEPLGLEDMQGSEY